MPRSPSGAYRTARTAAAASAPLATPGTWIPSTPSSSVCLMIVGSFAATRTIVCADVAASASTTARSVASVNGPCSASTTT